MTTAGAVKKLERAGFAVENDGMHFTAKKSGFAKIVEFAKNGREDCVTCIRVRRENDKDEIHTDYSAGFFVDNITQAIKAVSL